MTTHNTVSSNAFNAASFVSNGVDPRTGQYTVSVSLPELNGNQLCGPALNLALSFSPINNQDCGYGIGWDLPLSQYQPTTRVLSLSTGEAFKVQGSGDAATIPEQKIETFKFYVEGTNRYRVAHKSGLIELLRHEGSGSSLMALPYEIHSEQGHVLYLTHKPWNDGHRLDEVRQADGKLLLRVIKQNNTVDFHYQGGDEATFLATFSLQLEGNRLRYLHLPSQTPQDAGQWEFDYETIRDLTCIKRVRSPHGAVETVEHRDGGHAFPGINRPAMPRVTRHVIAPGPGLSVIDSRYEYSANNFLGYGAPGLVYTEDGLDNLYKVNAAYDYHSVHTLWHDETPVRSVTSVYNRYHLLTQQLTRKGDTLMILGSEYHLDDGLPFDLQPAQCQLPRKTFARWALANDPTRLYEESKFTRFDAFGNPVEEIDESGVRQTWEYYSALGDEGCPPDPYGFTRLLKEHRRYPAAPLPPRQRKSIRATPRSRQRATGAPSFDDEPVLISRFVYATHPPLRDGLLPTLVLQSKVDTALTAQGEQAILSTFHTYIDEPDDPGQHGKPLTTAEHREGDIATTTQSYDFALSPGFMVSKQRVVHSLDGTESEILSRTTLYTGLLVESQSEEGLVIAYEHDPLRRVITETAMPGHANEAKRRYRFKAASTADQFSEQYEVNALGVETKTQIDGIGRTLRRWRQKADGSSDAAAFQLLYSAEYGHDMAVLSDTQHDWLGDIELTITQRYEYDDWDQCCRVVDSTGIGRNTLFDPFTQTTTEWQDGMAKTVTVSNRFGKPERVDVLGMDDTRLSRQRFFYDGYGQLRLSLGACGERSEYEYDVFGRATLNVLPDRTRLEHHYALHSDAPLVTRLQLTHGNRALPGVQAGTQRFDGLNRAISSSSGQRTTHYLYSGSRTVADARLTPSDERIDYAYNLALSEAPISITAEQEVTFDYHPVTAALTMARSAQGTREYQYDGAGHLSLERSVIDGQVRENRYQMSVAGRMRQREDFTGLVTDYHYDDHGRLVKANEGQLEARFEYNAQGQRSRTTTQDLTSANTLVTEIEYDALGREVLRTQRLSRAAEHVTALRWALSGQLRERELRIGGAVSLHEAFAYDPRGRLVEHKCSGPDLPTDRYGNAISEQQFYFDGLDNLLFCTSYFADGSRDNAEHFYAADDSCQLRSITHTHPDYPARTQLRYDADGNLLVDGDGRRLSYDRQGRLQTVTQPDDTVLARYRYDAHGNLQGVTQGSATETLRFYDENQLRTTVQGERLCSFSYDGDVPLGQQQHGQPAETLLTLCGASHSVMAQIKGQDEVKTTRYSSHGVASDPLDSALGYNGEVREADTGWYLLGSGYRTYDPQLMCFHSPDSASPFGAGGLNPYAYCLGNPIRYRDPTGHMAQAYHPGRVAAERRAALKDAALDSAMTSGLIGLGMLAWGISAISGPVGWALLAVNAVALAARTAMEHEYIKNDDFSMVGVQVLDTVLTLDALYMKIPKKTIRATAARPVAGANVVEGIVPDVAPTSPTPRRNSISATQVEYAGEGATTQVPKTNIVLEGPSTPPNIRRSIPSVEPMPSVNPINPPASNPSSRGTSNRSSLSSSGESTGKNSTLNQDQKPRGELYVAYAHIHFGGTKSVERWSNAVKRAKKEIRDEAQQLALSK
jgi:RHS repeat-associated protein